MRTLDVSSCIRTEYSGIGAVVAVGRGNVLSNGSGGGGGCGGGS